MQPAIDLTTYTGYLKEIGQQPPWRTRADKEMDYRDGNQLDSEILQALNAKGIPPSIENVIGPTLRTVLGMEVRSRADWRVQAEQGNEQMAIALSTKLHEAERLSEADKAISAGYDSQIGAGLGWVEVSRNQNPFEYPYRCNPIHRNEIWWDWHSKRADLSDARYLLRRKWMGVDQAKLMFWAKRALIEQVSGGWQGFETGLLTDGGTSTDLYSNFVDERGWSIEEMEWLDTLNNRTCLFELWYRIWGRVVILKSRAGKVVEMDRNSPIHNAAVADGYAQPSWAIVPKVRLSWWIGPHLLHDGPSPYKHNMFPYVPFFGFREDRTGAPYGITRDMMYLQDEINARISRMQWGLAAVKTVMTKGALAMSKSQFANEAARPDAIIELDRNHMSQPGAMFKSDRDFQLNAQQYNRLLDCRESINRVTGVHQEFRGEKSGDQSGVALNTLVDQTVQGLADINDNFRAGRMGVGNLLLSLIIEDIGTEPHPVTVKGNFAEDDRQIILNEPTVDEIGGQQFQFISNDIQQVKTRVVLDDVPSTPTFKAQQLQTLGTAMKNMPPQYQLAMAPLMISLMDLPDRDAVMKILKDIDKKITPEQVKAEIDEAVAAALEKAGIEIKLREVAVKERIADKEVIKKGVEAAQAAMETGAILAMNPAVGALGDGIIEVAEVIGAPAPQPEAPPIPVQADPGQPAAMEEEPVEGETEMPLPEEMQPA